MAGLTAGRRGLAEGLGEASRVDALYRIRFDRLHLPLEEWAGLPLTAGVCAAIEQILGRSTSELGIGG